MENYKRYENESEEELIFRICKDKETIGSWEEVGDILNKLLGYEFTSSKYRKQYQNFQKMFVANQSKFVNEQAILDEIKEQRRELEKERKKIQTEKLEYNRYLRSDARDEMIVEKISNALQSNNIVNLNKHNIESKQGNRQGVLCFGDEHYGKMFKILGLNGEIINEYNSEVFERRMEKLLDETIKICKKERLDSIKVFNMGDFVEGVLRISNLLIQEIGVIESSVRYSVYLANWLNELTKYVNVEFQKVDGNHSMLRMLNTPKGTFENENTSIILRNEILRTLKGNPNFKYIENPTGFIFSNVCGYNLIGIHESNKSYEQSLKDFSMIYNKPIDYLLHGHYHHSSFKEVGIQKGVIGIPSIIGIDGYSMSIFKTSTPSAKFLIFEENKGQVQENTIVLN